MRIKQALGGYLISMGRRSLWVGPEAHVTLGRDNGQCRTLPAYASRIVHAFPRADRPGCCWQISPDGCRHSCDPHSRRFLSTAAVGSGWICWLKFSHSPPCTCWQRGAASWPL